MTTQLLAIIASVLTIAIGIWRYFKRLNSAKRKIAQEAKEKLDEAHKTGNKSDLLDSWDRINRV